MENSLTEMSFFQAYRNWLMIIDIITTPDVAIGWYEHHSRMLRDDRFMAFFDVLWDMGNYVLNLSPACSKLNLTAPPTFNCWRDPAWLPFLHAPKKLSRLLNSSGLHAMDPIQLETKVATLVLTDTTHMIRNPTKVRLMIPFSGAQEAYHVSLLWMHQSSGQ